jgi:hypothetical protein
VRKLGIKFPAIIDGFENRTEIAYTGWPDRLYLIDRDGKVVYKSKPGPFGFKPDQLEEALKKLPQGQTLSWLRQPLEAQSSGIGVERAATQP